MYISTTFFRIYLTVIDVERDEMSALIAAEINSGYRSKHNNGCETGVVGRTIRVHLLYLEKRAKKCTGTEIQVDIC